ncbi:hypothetical protein K469DRAFT_208709 [Zopfia rhizophila CBS 207.26]|uniref:Uncharacterized protein n=1 Tax=Zopfia rhizophila CBS 207.26 TaxID=1314779 RepID=A0A6A6DV86_9PEZI|nr:hypothetical protein K469DRAFT_208709 [Zopfia rhizophila CBS 207.26]
MKFFTAVLALAASVAASDYGYGASAESSGKPLCQAHPQSNTNSAPAVASSSYVGTVVSSAAPLPTKPVDEACSVVTITTTVTIGHTPSAPGSYPSGPTAQAPYPSAPAPYPSAPAPYPSAPAGTASSYPAPSGTGVYNPTSPPAFTGAASAMKVPAGVAGVMGLVAYFL